MTGSREAAHVDADLRDNDLSAEITDAWVGAQQAHGLAERVEIAVMAVDTLGHLLAVHVTPADVGDRRGRRPSC